MNLMVASASANKVKNALAVYNNAAKSYIAAEKQWLPKDKQLLDSFAFNLFMPSYAKDSVQDLYQTYYDDYLSTVYLEQAWASKDAKTQTDLSNKVVEITKQGIDAQQNYDNITKAREGKTYWVVHFITLPKQKCPDKNYDFPQVPNY